MDPTVSLFLPTFSHDSHEFEVIQEPLTNKTKEVSSILNFNFRYEEDDLSLNN